MKKIIALIASTIILSINAFAAGSLEARANSAQTHGSDEGYAPSNTCCDVDIVGSANGQVINTTTGEILSRFFDGHSSASFGPGYYLINAGSNGGYSLVTVSW